MRGWAHLWILKKKKRQRVHQNVPLWESQVRQIKTNHFRQRLDSFFSSNCKIHFISWSRPPPPRLYCVASIEVQLCKWRARGREGGWVGPVLGPKSTTSSDSGKMQRATISQRLTLIFLSQDKNQQKKGNTKKYSDSGKWFIPIKNKPGQDVWRKNSDPEKCDNVNSGNTSLEGS